MYSKSLILGVEGKKGLKIVLKTYQDEWLGGCIFILFCFLQGTQRKPKSLPPLDPEVLSVFVPPFISREDTQVINAGNNLNKSKRRSFRKKKERPKIENVKSQNGEQKAPDTEDITVPKDIDLIGLPQLCFPGTAASHFFMTPVLIGIC